MEIKEERIFLEEFKKKHVQEYYEFFINNDFILKATKTEKPPTLKETFEIQEFWEKSDNLCLVIALKEDKKLIGDVNIVHYGYMETNEAEISIMISFAKHRKKGFGTETLKLAEKLIKQNLLFTRLIAKIDLDNEISINFFKKNGY